MEVAVLGPVEIRRAGSVVDLGTPKQRALVAALALSRGRAVAVDTIVDLLWGETAPPGVTATLQAYVSGLRRVLEPDRERRTPATVLVTVAPGYALRTPDDALDVRLFEDTVAAEHRRLQVLSASGPSPLSAGDLTVAVERLDVALGRWRGTPYGELGDAASAVAERARLEELRVVALEDRAVAGLALGHHGTVAAELEALTATYPLRERLWALWVLALTRAGRQADALGALRRLREVLDDELGLEPSAELRDLQTAVLRQDPALDWVRPEQSTAPVVPAPRSAAEPEARAAAPAVTEAVAPWPMVGRDDQLTALTSALDAAEAGSPSYAVITGEPGIGKSRLAAELVALARRRGHRVLVGRCSQDDGAPPLWPWATILEALGVGLEPELDTLDEGGQFRSWERIARAVRDAAREQVTVVVLDDLHWADTSTLRVLRLLAETVADRRLLVLATWRPHPEPTGSLADVAESLARKHAVRLQLTGLTTDGVAEVFATVAESHLSGQQAQDLRERTDGNPFFLVEYARLAGARTDLDTLLGEDNPPTAVSEVLTRRLTRLSDETVSALRTAAVIGRQFDTPTLAAVTGIDEDDLLDVVEPAQAAGLVREDGIDRFLFAHALVRDTLRAGMSASRRARAHAKVATALDGAPGRETEVALHWLEAGPSYAGRAWRAAVAAAAVARRLHAHDEAADLLRAALEAMDADPAVADRDRYDVLMGLIEAYRWSARLPELVQTVEQAIAVGKSMRDPAAVATAALATTRGGLWRSAPPGQLNDIVIDALRGSLDRLPTADGELRCLTMLALANELFSTSSFEERRALVDESLAMARRIGDPRLKLDSCQIAFVALWSADTVPERLELAEESLALARELGDERAVVVSGTLHTIALCELGRRKDMLVAADFARGEAQRLRISYGEMVLDGLELPWQAMAGDFEACGEIAERIRSAAGRISHSHGEETVAGAVMAQRLWGGNALEAAPLLAALDVEYDLWSTLAVFCWRGGDEAQARAVHAERRGNLVRGSHSAPLAWGHAAELALYLGDADLAGRAYEPLATCAGYSCGSGSNLASGPVDAYLAMAAAATGERVIAARHAEDALALAEEWEIPLFAQWFRELRTAHGF